MIQSHAVVTPSQWEAICYINIWLYEAQIYQMLYRGKWGQQWSLAVTGSHWDSCRHRTTCYQLLCNCAHSITATRFEEENILGNFTIKFHSSELIDISQLSKECSGQAHDSLDVTHLLPLSPAGRSELRPCIPDASSSILARGPPQSASNSEAPVRACPFSPNWAWLS